MPLGVEEHGRVVDSVLEIGDHHAGDRDLEPPEEREEEIVGQRARRHAILEREGDAGGLGGADHHGEAAPVALALQHDGGLEPARVEEDADHRASCGPARRRRLRGQMRGRRRRAPPRREAAARSATSVRAFAIAILLRDASAPSAPAVSGPGRAKSTRAGRAAAA